MRNTGRILHHPMRMILTVAVLFLLPWSMQLRAEEDARRLVELPEMMREHMLGNMRDHLRAVGEILGHLAAGEAEKAAQTAETRLGMSSMQRHGAAHLAPFMPEEMARLGMQMHRAASRFALVVRDAEVLDDTDARRKVLSALKEVTDNCNACHQGYRVR